MIRKIFVIVLMFFILNETLAEDSPFYGLVWSHNGFLLAGRGENFLKIWNADGNLLIDLSNEIQGRVTGLSWSFDNTKIATLGTENLISIWDITVPQKIFTMQINNEDYPQLLTISWSSDETQLIIGSSNGDYGLIFIDIASAQVVKTMNSGWVWTMAMNSDYSQGIVSEYSAPATLVDFDTISPNPTRDIGSVDDPVALSFEWSNNDNMIVAGYTDGQIRIYDANSLTLIKSLPTTQNTNINTVSFNINDQYLAVAFQNGVLEFWDLNTDTLIRSEIFNTTPNAKFNPVNSKVAITGNDNKLIILPSWDTPLVYFPTDTPTFTPTDTATSTFTPTPSPTDTPTSSFTPTPTSTFTPTPTATDTPTSTFTPTPTSTNTATSTFTPTP